MTTQEIVRIGLDTSRPWILGLAEKAEVQKILVDQAARVKGIPQAAFAKFKGAQWED